MKVINGSTSETMVDGIWLKVGENDINDAQYKRLKDNRHFAGLVKQGLLSVGPADGKIPALEDEHPPEKNIVVTGFDVVQMDKLIKACNDIEVLEMFAESDGRPEVQDMIIDRISEIEVLDDSRPAPDVQSIDPNIVTAKVMIEYVNNCEDLEEVEHLKGIESRPTVIAVIDARIFELRNPE